MAVSWAHLSLPSDKNDGYVYVSVDPLGLNNLAAAAFQQTPTVAMNQPSLLGTFIAVPAQDYRGISGVQPWIAYDDSSGPNSGRLYLLYSSSNVPLQGVTAPEKGGSGVQNPNAVLSVNLEYSTNNGASFAPDLNFKNNSSGDELIPNLAVDPITGDVAVAWYGTSSPSSPQTQYYGSVSSSGGNAFSPAVHVSVGTSNVALAMTYQYGDYSAVAFYNGELYPAWIDNSPQLQGNPSAPLPGVPAPTVLPETDSAVARVAVATVGWTPPVVTGLSISTKEGSVFSGQVATFTDADPVLTSTDFTVTINWGDGTTADTTASVTPSGAADNHFIIRDTHTYVTAGAYIVSVTVQDDVNSLTATTTTDVSQMSGNHVDGTIAVDPNDSSRQFAASVKEGTGLYVATSSDGGMTWSGITIAAGGSDGLPVAGGRPQAVFDQFGNLFLTYVDQTGDHIVVAMSTDGGKTFTTLDSFFSAGGVSRPLVTAGPGPGGAGSVWVTFLEGTQIAATGTDVDSLGVVGVFNPVQVVARASEGATLNFGGIAVGPTGQVLISYQTQTTPAGPSAIYAELDATGVSPGGFAAPVLVTTTNVGGSDPIPPEAVHTVGTGAGLAWDRSGTAHNGRVYLVYTDTATLGSQATRIFVRYSDDNGKTWSAPETVSDDTGDNSEFLPSIAVDPSDGDVAAAWYDARNDPNDIQTQFFAAVSINGAQSFSPNVPVGLGSSDATSANLNAFGQQNQYGDYTGLAFVGGILYPLWADNSAALGGNPDLPQFDLALGRPGVAQVADLPLSATPLDISAAVKYEGGAFTANLATFIDPDPDARVGLYTATIDWGDPDPITGAADTTTGVITSNGGSQFTVSGTHVYQAASAYTITITITDIGGSFVSVTTPALIQDAPLNPGGDVALTAYEGQPFQGIVGTFTDTDPNGAPDDYNTTINWGDGTQSSGLVTFAGSAALTYDSLSSVLYTFGNNDLVAGNPSYLMAISLQGVVTPVAPAADTLYGGLAFDTDNSTLFAISNADNGVSTLMAFDFSTQTFSPVAVLGTGFTGGLAYDSVGGDLYAIASQAAGWELDQISPADGSVSVVGTLSPPGNQAPLSYTGLSFDADENLYAVGNDSDGNSTLYQLALGSTLTDMPLFSLGNDLVTPPSSQEGFTGGLAFVPTSAGNGSELSGSLIGISGDGSGTTYLNTIDLDGTTASAFEVFVAGSSGQGKSASGDFSNGFNVIGSHTYAQVMSAQLTVSIEDVEPSQVPNSVVRSTATDHGVVTVDLVPPQALPAPPAFMEYQGSSTGSLNLASFTVPGGVGASLYSATIDWNDGSPIATGVVALTGNTIVVSGQHTYLTQGSFTPIIVLNDDTGGSATVSDAVSVTPDLSALPAPAAVTAFQNDSTGALSLASFSVSAGLPGASSDSYSATISWGDNGPKSAGTILISGSTVAVSGSHTYASAGTFQPAVLLRDDSKGGSATVTDTLTVLADVTKLVHAVSSGPIYNPLTQLFNGNVTFTNTSAGSLTGPFPLVFQGLTPGVTLANATGVTGGGVSYISDPLATLAPGQSTTVAVQFKDPGFVPIAYALQILDPPPSDPVQLITGIDPSLISASADGGVEGSISMSADGRYIAFQSGSPNPAVPTAHGSSISTKSATRRPD